MTMILILIQNLLFLYFKAKYNDFIINSKIFVNRDDFNFGMSNALRLIRIYLSLSVISILVTLGTVIIF